MSIFDAVSYRLSGDLVVTIAVAVKAIQSQIFSRVRFGTGNGAEYLVRSICLHSSGCETNGPPGQHSVNA